MSPAVDLEDVILEVFDAQAQPGDSHLTDRRQLVIGQRPGLTLEGHFLHLVPGEDGLQPLRELFELILAIALSAGLLALIGTAINLYLLQVDAGRSTVENNA